MVDAVGSVSPRNSNPSGNTTRTVAPVSASSPTRLPEGGFVTSQIVVDNLQNVAILQMRSAKTGEVVQQYPSQSQIEAFHRAEQLRSAAVQSSSAPAEQTSSSAPAPQQQQTAPAAPAPVAPPSGGSTASTGGSGSGEGSTSIVV